MRSRNKGGPDTSRTWVHCAAHVSQLCVLLSLTVPPGRALAQSTGLEIGLLRSGAFEAGGPLSVVETTRFNTVELDISLPLASGDNWRLDLPIGLIPLAWVQETALGPASVASSGDHWVVPTENGRATSRGFGIRPVGVRGIFGKGRVRLQAEASGGILRFSIPTPSSNATKVNLTGELGVGLRAELVGAHFGFGYRLHHLSNAGRGTVNPGIDSHMFYVGFWVHR